MRTKDWAKKGEKEERVHMFTPSYGLLPQPFEFIMNGYIISSTLFPPVGSEPDGDLAGQKKKKNKIKNPRVIKKGVRAISEQQKARERGAVGRGAERGQ